MRSFNPNKLTIEKKGHSHKRKGIIYRETIVLLEAGSQTISYQWALTNTWIIRT
jgi:hypothetical protein